MPQMVVFACIQRFRFKILSPRSFQNAIIKVHLLFFFVKEVMLEDKKNEKLKNVLKLPKILN